MISLFQHLFEYDQWASSLILQALRDAGDGPEEAVLLFAHVLGAKEVWFRRMTNDHPEACPIFPEWSLDECAARLQSTDAAATDMLSILTDENLLDVIRYNNSKGRPFTNLRQEVFLHIVNHGTHHRAQICRLLREQGHVPPVTDQISFTRRSAEG